MSASTISEYPAPSESTPPTINLDFLGLSIPVLPRSQISLNVGHSRSPMRCYPALAFPFFDVIFFPFCAVLPQLLTYVPLSSESRFHFYLFPRAMYIESVSLCRKSLMERPIETTPASLPPPPCPRVPFLILYPNGGRNSSAMWRRGLPFEPWGIFRDRHAFPFFLSPSDSNSPPDYPTKSFCLFFLFSLRSAGWVSCPCSLFLEGLPRPLHTFPADVRFGFVDSARCLNQDPPISPANITIGPLCFYSVILELGRDYELDASHRNLMRFLTPFLDHLADLSPNILCLDSSSISRGLLVSFLRFFIYIVSNKLHSPSQPVLAGTGNSLNCFYFF